MKQLTIKPKEAGTTIKFGKLPLLTRSLDLFADMDNVVQIVVDGGYYAVEQRPKVKHTEDVDSAMDKLEKSLTDVVAVQTSRLEDAIEPKKDEEAHASAILRSKTDELESGLEKLGFTNLKYETETTVKKTGKRGRPAGKRKKEKVDIHGRPTARGSLSLFEWLKKTDYLVYTFFVGGGGVVNMDKRITREDVVDLFVDNGLPTNPNKSTIDAGATAERMANAAILCLRKIGVLRMVLNNLGEKEYSLSLTKGSYYAHKVYATVSKGEYAWDTRKGRVLQEP